MLYIACLSNKYTSTMIAIRAFGKGLLIVTKRPSHYLGFALFRV